MHSAMNHGKLSTAISDVCWIYLDRVRDITPLRLGFRQYELRDPPDLLVLLLHGIIRDAMIALEG